MSLLGVEWGPVWVSLVATCGALTAAGVTWAIARRSASGSIATSDAATLWAAAEEIRRNLRDEVDRQRKDNAELRERIAVLEDQVRQLKEQARE